MAMFVYASVGVMCFVGLDGEGIPTWLAGRRNGQSPIGQELVFLQASFQAAAIALGNIRFPNGWKL